MYKRHVLVEITQAGRERILNSMPKEDMCNKYYQSLLLPEKFSNTKRHSWQPHCQTIPAIVRRRDENTPNHSIAVGFSSWQRINNSRIKVASFVAEHEIIAAMTPYDVAEIATNHVENYTHNNAMSALFYLANKFKHEVLIGVWGSVALEIITGFGYIHKNSDLDLILSFSNAKNINLNELLSLSNCINDVEKKYGLRIDPEIELSNGYGVSLKELCTSSNTLLGKSISDVSLLSRETVYANLSI